MSRTDFFRNYDASQVRYVTLEFSNSGFGTLRYVTNHQSTVDLRLETGAPRNPDTVQTFTPAPFKAPEPEQSDENEVELNIAIAGVTGQILELMKGRNKQQPVYIVWREHLSGSTYPTVVFYFEMTNLQIEQLAANIKAAQPNYSGLDIARRYTTDDFPGLGTSR